MYLNNGKLKAPTLYQFPPLQLNPGESIVVTFTVKEFHDIIQCPKSPWNSETRLTNDDYWLCCRVHNYFFSDCDLIWELTFHRPMETFKNFGEDMTERSVSGQRCGKWILQMIGDLEMLVHVNFTEISRGRSVSADFDIRTIGP